MGHDEPSENSSLLQKAKKSYKCDEKSSIKETCEIFFSVFFVTTIIFIAVRLYGEKKIYKQTIDFVHVV